MKERNIIIGTTIDAKKQAHEKGFYKIQGFRKKVEWLCEVGKKGALFF